MTKLLFFHKLHLSGQEFADGQYKLTDQFDDKEESSNSMSIMRAKANHKFPKF